MLISKYKIYLAINDFISFLIVFYLTAEIVFLHNFDLTSFILFNNITVNFIFILSSIIFVFILQSNNLYKLNFILVTSLHLTHLIKSLLYTWLFFIFLSFIFKQGMFLDSRLFVFYGILISILYFVVVRILFIEKFILRNFGNKILKTKVLIYGAGKNGKLLSTKFSFENPYGIEIVGFIDDDPNKIGKVINGVKVLGNLNNLEFILNNHKIDEIIIGIENTDYNNFINLIEFCKEFQIKIKIASNLFDVIPQKIVVEEFAQIPLINATPPVKSHIFFISKRIIDIIGSLFAIIILTPFFIIISILIKLSSPGPIIYKQVRIGKDGKPFNFYKFRSMKIISEELDLKRQVKMKEFIKNNYNDNNGTTKIVDANRITRIGKFLRKYSLDELPQLVNVLKGDMSLVGPRPCLPYEYEVLDQWQKKRFDVLPGCTGVWQVFGRSKVSYKDSVILDLYYVNNMNPWLDIQLILKTIPVIIYGKGGV